MCINYVFFLKLLFLFVYFQSTQQKALDAKQHLFTYGFLDSPNPDETVLKAGIKKFQKATGLEISGVLNNKTLAKMSSPRCGRVSNTPIIFSPRKRWYNSTITYKLQNLTEPFAKSQIKQFFDDAIMVWTNSVNLTIKESSSDQGDINVYFVKNDGDGATLGFAYPPENGDIFFDKDEDWTLESSLAWSKVYFGWVVAHEIGHSLGLLHSETMDSVMFPYYTETVVLPTATDVNRLRTLYGQAATDTAILCNATNICAMLNMDDNIIIKGKQYWTLSGGSVSNGPFSLHLIYPRLPDTIDAAFAVRGTAYFFKDNVFYRFKSNTKMPLRKLISVGFEGVPTGINAAFYESSSRIIYFFKGSKYYAFDVSKSTGNRLTINGKSIANNWGGIPNDVEAAILSGNNTALFIKESRCYTVDMTSKELLSNEDCKKTLFKC